MKQTKKILSLLVLCFPLFSCNKKGPSECLNIAMKKETFNYSELLSADDFIVNKGSNKLINNFRFENYDAFSNKTQHVKVVDNETEDYGYIDLTLSPINGMKVLFIANSHAQDTLAYSYEIAISAGLSNFKFANLFLPGAQISMHLDNYNKNNPYYVYEEYKGGKSVDTPEVDIRSIVKSDNWDFIVVQQLSSLVKNKGFVKDMDALIKLAKEDCPNKNVKILFNFTFSYADMGNDTTLELFYDNDPHKMFEVNAQTVKDYVLPDENIDAIIPIGTTAENASTSYLGVNGIHRDSLHMNDIGRYIIAHTFVCKISGVYIDNMTYKGDFNHAVFNIAHEASASAIENPFVQTPSIYKD